MSSAAVNAKDQAYFFDLGSTLRNRWKIETLLGAGACGQVFLASDGRDKLEVAIKTEKLDRTLCMEVGVMRSVNNNPRVPFLMACGRTDKCRYMVMECLNMSLIDVLKNNPHKTFPLEVTCQITLQMISAIKAVHDAGYIHRDIKPANFAFGKHRSVTHQLFIYDFGLARIHLTRDKEPRKRRRNVGFKGTMRYASIACHQGKDLGRVDDLIPMFYSILEMNKGPRGLPWKGISDREKIVELKENTAVKDLCGGLPCEFERMITALYKANYYAQPRYDKLSGLCTNVLRKMNIDPNSALFIPGLNLPVRK